ncbi:MAG: NADH-quinone oxidoreductase subunit M [Verrucomicrobia bacterium]|nr:MAG: NADH-quinone oxidoreductase subunit M [Verrucomicrobiota bacterium]
MNTIPILTIITFLPLAGGLIVMGLPSSQSKVARGLALAFSLIALALGLGLWRQFQPASGSLQFEEGPLQWIPTLAVQYHVGVDGLGLLMVLLTALVVPMAVLASWKIEDRAPLYFGLVLLLQSGLFGTFTALNFFHWFIFWELSLIPAFFLIKLWGGPLRTPAATQFFIYTMVGSVTLLMAFLAIFLVVHEFDFIKLAEMGRNGTLISELSNQLGWRDLTTRRLALVLFGGAFLGFAVKTPLMPFHTWLPSAYAEAPTGTTMLLTGLMSKMGVYGFLRILVPIFPQEMVWLSKWLLVLAVVTIVFSAGAAFAQRDLKRIFAYSSINHLGYCLLGTFAVISSGSATSAPLVEKAAALNGVFLQMFNHGLTAAVLFWFVGILQERAHGLRGIEDFGGLRKVAPVLCGLMGIALFSSLGLPGLNGFIGEFLIFKGAFPLVTWAATLSVLGLLITAVFILTVAQKVFHGPLNQKWSSLPDLTSTERAWLLPAFALIFVLGIYPQAILGVVNSTVVQMVAHLNF